MTWFLVVISEILLILIGVAIVAMSYELPQLVVKPQQPPLDNPSDSSDNNSIEIEKEDDYE
jgi:hypothetical protein